MQSYDYLVYTFCGFMLAMGALLVLARVAIYQQRLTQDLTKKLMSMTTQFPHKAYIEMSEKAAEIQLEQWKAARDQATQAQATAPWPQDWQHREAGG